MRQSKDSDGSARQASLKGQFSQEADIDILWQQEQAKHAKLWSVSKDYKQASLKSWVYTWGRQSREARVSLLVSLGKTMTRGNQGYTKSPVAQAADIDSDVQALSPLSQLA